jgi:hypothetical protein
MILCVGADQRSVRSWWSSAPIVAARDMIRDYWPRRRDSPDQVATAFAERRYPAKPSPAKPSSISAHVEGSGTAPIVNV